MISIYLQNHYFMKDSNIFIVTDSVIEARRYIQNAKDLLEEKGGLNTANQLYSDRKYVRMAGSTLWNGVLLILDAVFHVKASKKSRPDIIDYEKAIAKRDKKLLELVVVGYDVMHLSMGYDGILKKSICQEGFEMANEIVNRCAVMLKGTLGTEQGQLP